MTTTPITLLERLRQPDPEPAWDRFVQLYTPLLYYWALKLHLSEHDAADLVQDVFTVLLEKLPGFVHDGRHSFCAWMRTLMFNRWRDQQRRRRELPADPDAEPLADLAEPDGLDAFTEADYRKHLVSRALQIMQTEFQPATWKACWEHVAAGRPAQAVAAELGISVNAVYLATSRVLRRLRQELHGLLD